MFVKWYQPQILFVPLIFLNITATCSCVFVPGPSTPASADFTLYLRKRGDSISPDRGLN